MFVRYGIKLHVYSPGVFRTQKSTGNHKLAEHIRVQKSQDRGLHANSIAGGATYMTVKLKSSRLRSAHSRFSS